MPIVSTDIPITSQRNTQLVQTLAGQYPIGMMVVLLAGIIQFCRAAADFARHFRKDE